MFTSCVVSRFFFFFQAEDGIRDAQESRGLGDVYKRQLKSDFPECFRANQPTAWAETWWILLPSLAAALFVAAVVTYVFRRQLYDRMRRVLGIGRGGTTNHRSSHDSSLKSHSRMV
eukprot:TRINITY_DN27742_c0_g1_i1.p1 TRINITY_DN27742_c0_g1~~TRINITY_DN27742_c0_g1_i1.p1  ORF type:complete len:116 (-),score=17.45 TRINITY_DN27742_c0_g1_i1:406-753(-)